MIRLHHFKTLLYMLIFCILVIPPYLNLKVSSFPGINPERLLIFICSLLFILFYLHIDTYKKRLESYIIEFRGIFFFSFLLYTLNIFSSLVFSDNTLSSTFNAIIRLLSQLMLLLFVLSCFTKEDIPKILKYILTLQLIIICLAALEYFLGNNLFSSLAFMNENVREDLIIGNFREGKYRVTATMPHSLVLAQLIVILLPINHIFLYSSKSKFLPIINLLASPIILYLTDSRMGIALYLLFYILLFILLIFNKLLKAKHLSLLGTFSIRILAISFLAFIILFSINYESALQNLEIHVIENSYGESEQTTNSTLARIIQLNIGLENISIFGYGSTGTENIIQTYDMKSMDNFYITLLLNTGVLGLISFLYLNYIILNRLAHNFTLQYSFGFLLFFLNYLIFAVVLSIDYLMSLYFIFLGVVLIYIKSDRNIKSVNLVKLQTQRV